MFEKSNAGGPADPRRPGPASVNATSLDESPCSDGVIGMGYFPEELALPSGWTWIVMRAEP